MNSTLPTDQMLSGIEADQHYTFVNREEIRQLLELSRNPESSAAFEQLLFDAKFVTKTHQVMKRLGPGGDGFEKLSAEFQSGVTRCMEHLRTILKPTSAETQAGFEMKFLQIRTENFTQFLSLLADLTVLKNKSLDERTVLPASSIPMEKPDNAPRIKTMKQLRSMALLVILLEAVYLLVEVPVTTIGWILSVVIMMSAVSLAAMIHSEVTMEKKT